jgi:hypothetical protein
MHGRLCSDRGRTQACIVPGGVWKCGLKEALAMLPGAMSKSVARHVR